MPQIIVIADHDGDDAVTFHERVSSVLFESRLAATQLLERLEWAVADAHAVERRGTRVARERSARREVEHPMPAPSPAHQHDHDRAHAHERAHDRAHDDDAREYEHEDAGAGLEPAATVAYDRSASVLTTAS